MKLENQNYNKPILKEEEGNNTIIKYFKKNVPFMAARAGGTETNIICQIIKRKEKITNQLKNMALSLSGIYPNDELNLEKFAYNYVECIKSVDIMGVWPVDDYDWMVNEYCPNAHYIRLWGLEPYYFKEPWSQCLENKKVLVVHPFEKSIINNYKNKNKIFNNPKTLPEFELKTIKAEQNLSNTESNYFETIKRTQEKISNIEFDIAIIGCGAQGLPLASFIKKELKKTSIHMAGATQILFGIIGKRWEKYPQTRSIVNEYWTRPLPEETPKNFELVENGCYW